MGVFFSFKYLFFHYGWQFVDSMILYPTLVVSCATKISHRSVEAKGFRTTSFFYFLLPSIILLKNLKFQGSISAVLPRESMTGYSVLFLPHERHYQSFRCT